MSALAKVAGPVALGVSPFADTEISTNMPPFPQKLSLAPTANWGMLVSHGGTEAQSLFWHCVTESNTLVLTWQDALYARSHTKGRVLRDLRDLQDLRDDQAHLSRPSRLSRRSWRSWRSREARA